MKYYPICTFKEFYVDVSVAKRELTEWWNRKLWNPLCLVETNPKDDLLKLRFSTELFKDIRTVWTLSINSLSEDVVITSRPLGNGDLNLTWNITIKGKNKEQLLISTILLEGNLAGLYYERYAVCWTKLLKNMNRDFIHYLNRKYLSTTFMVENGCTEYYPIV